MMRLLTPLLSLSLTTAQPAHIPTLNELPWNAIVLLRCGEATGTAFHIGGGRYLTAAHVVSFGSCSIDGSPAKLLGTNGQMDIAEVEGPAITSKLEIDCGGYRVNRHYLAIGYAGGTTRINYPLIYSAFGRDPGNGNGMFVGADVIPGMSGGPMLNEAFKVSGIVNQRYPSRSRSLADTYLCRGGSHA